MIACKNQLFFGTTSLGFDVATSEAKKIIFHKIFEISNRTSISPCPSNEKLLSDPDHRKPCDDSFSGFYPIFIRICGLKRRFFEPLTKNLQNLDLNSLKHVKYNCRQ